jgi:hypothetical protein
MSRILVSFQYAIAALIDRRILFIHSAVCEEVFQVTQTVSAKELPELAEQHPKEIASQLKDFPLMLRIVSLHDGVEIEHPPEVIVKWSNVAAICNLSDEQWTSIRKSPRKKGSPK